MAEHVDLVFNDWKQRVQRSVGRIVANGAVVTKDIDVTGIRHAVEDAICAVDHDLAPSEQLVLVAGAFQGTRVFATEIHDEDCCPFADSDTVEFSTLSAPGVLPLS